MTQADRWHAALLSLRPILRLSIAFIWLATGIVSAFASTAQGFELLRRWASPGRWPPWHIRHQLPGNRHRPGDGHRLARRLIGAVQLALMAGFMLILTFGMPGLWLHPFGPLTKNVPLIAATLVMMALEDCAMLFALKKRVWTALLALFFVAAAAFFFRENLDLKWNLDYTRIFARRLACRRRPDRQ